MDASIWLFTGTGAFPNPASFTVAHDDGVTFVVGTQTVLNNPIPPGAISTGTYTGAAGSQTFNLYYAECCFGPAVHQVTGISPIPEPSSLPLVGGGFLGLLRYRKFLAG